MTKAIEAAQPAAAPALTLEQKLAASSQVQAISYDEGKRELTVEFKKGEAGGPPQFRYVYSQFPPGMWDELMAAPSLGSYLYRNVTGGKGRSTPFGFVKIDKASGQVVAKADRAE